MTVELKPYKLIHSSDREKLEMQRNIQDYILTLQLKLNDMEQRIEALENP